MSRRHTDAETLVRRGADGQFYVAAQDVTAILRDMARTFDLHAQSDEATWTPEGRTTPVRLDEDTMRTVASILRAQADEMEVQLIEIAATSTPSAGPASTLSAGRPDRSRPPGKGRGQAQR
ncbi:hypothetical protein EDD96_7077 [Streptomyces sp. Ag109_G2-6]|uniref:hypothetical protein n=1 Tax=Streptomyces TaxID=1883 RepID=UPI0009A5150D|nr:MULTISPECIES: hypothetical protein [Streptomyces]RPF25555.1 hypothetical protein EDD96_7077 [Streptomyces sp. Ag109_G2-6]